MCSSAPVGLPFLANRITPQLSPLSRSRVLTCAGPELSSSPFARRCEQTSGYCITVTVTPLIPFRSPRIASEGIRVDLYLGSLGARSAGPPRDGTHHFMVSGYHVLPPSSTLHRLFPASYSCRSLSRVRAASPVSSSLGVPDSYPRSRGAQVMLGGTCYTRPTS